MNDVEDHRNKHPVAMVLFFAYEDLLELNKTEKSLNKKLKTLGLLVAKSITGMIVIRQ